MRIRLLPPLCACAVLAAGGALAHDDESPANLAGKLGTVNFANSCDPKVQPAFERAVAMLHSFVYNVAEKAFAEIFEQDPTCAIATWGYASILMSNPLAGIGPTGDTAKKAQAMLGGNGARLWGLDYDYLHKVAQGINAPTLRTALTPIDKVPDAHSMWSFRTKGAFG